MRSYGYGPTATAPFHLALMGAELPRLPSWRMVQKEQVLSAQSPHFHLPPLCHGMEGTQPEAGSATTPIGRGLYRRSLKPRVVGAGWSSRQLHTGHWGWRGSSGAKGIERGFWGLPENSTGCRGLAMGSFAVGLLLQKCHQRKEGTNWWPSGFAIGLGFASPSKYLGKGLHSA